MENEQANTEKDNLRSPLYMMIFTIFNSISVGGTIVVAQYKGRNHMDKIRTAAGQTLLASGLLSIISCIILVIFAGSLVQLLFGEADPMVIKKATGYLI